MEIKIEYNSLIRSLFQIFYTNKESNLLESLNLLIADEKSFGTSKEQEVMILYLTNFYFEAIEGVRKSFNIDWTYLDWLTQDEYDIIMNKREILEY